MSTEHSYQKGARLAFDFRPQTRLIFGNGVSDRLGALARDAGFHRTLLVADRGLVASGHVDRASNALRSAGISVVSFHGFDSDPDSDMLEVGRAFAAAADVDSLVAWGGGSSLDCAKGINFLLTNGGRIHDYRGYGKAVRPMLPAIAVPTTAGTGSEVQSYAVISDAETGTKMACGDPKAAFRIALLDPVLTMSQPARVTAISGYDAVAHAVESAATLRRNILSDLFAREAWRLLEQNFQRVLDTPDNLDVRGAMQLGACYAGLAIECSMLGAAHACANPLTARYGTTHGLALAVLLPRVVRWNGMNAGTTYAGLLALAGIGNGSGEDPSERLARRLQEFAMLAELPANLRSLGVPGEDLPLLAEDATQQWTGTFNPRKLDAAGALEIYRAAF